MYEGAEKEGGVSWALYGREKPCSGAVSSGGRLIEFAATSVTVFPVYTNVETVSGQNENRVFLATPQCDAREVIPFSFSSPPAPQVTYRKQTFGILNLKANYRLINKDNIEVYAVGVPQGSSEEVEVVFAKLRLTEGRMILQSNGAYIVNDQSYTRITATDGK
jgi:hypothetical protein